MIKVGKMQSFVIPYLQRLHPAYANPIADQILQAAKVDDFAIINKADCGSVKGAAAAIPQ